MKFCMNMSLDNRTRYQGQSHMTGLSDFSPLRDGAKKLVYTITDEPLHSAWWYFAWTCILMMARTLFNFKVIGQRSRSHVFLLFFCVWYCGYPRTVLSLEAWSSSKAWWYCLYFTMIDYDGCCWQPWGGETSWLLLWAVGTGGCLPIFLWQGNMCLLSWYILHVLVKLWIT